MMPHCLLSFIQLKIRNDFDPVLSPESSLFVLKSNKQVRAFLDMDFVFVKTLSLINFFVSYFITGGLSRYSQNS